MTSTSDEKWRPFNCFFSRARLRTYRHPCKYTACLIITVYGRGEISQYIVLLEWYCWRKAEVLREFPLPFTLSLPKSPLALAWDWARAFENETLPTVPWHGTARHKAQHVTTKVQQRTARHDKVEHGTTRHNTVRHVKVQHGTARHDKVQHSTARQDTIRYTTARHGTTRHNTARHDTVGFL